MSKQDELDRIYARIARDHETLTKRQVAYATKEVGRVKAEIAELLTEFAADDGTIKRQRLSRLLRELDGVERDLRTYGTAVMDEVIGKSATFTTAAASAGVAGVIGVPLIESGFERLNRNVTNYVVRRFGEDGLVLSDRIWSVSGDIRDAIGAQLRSDIIRGESVNKMVANIRRVYANETWKIERLVITEGNTAYRAASALSVERSKVSDWAQIHDNGARHRRHKSHACYVLANEDRYGEGPGVFKPTDSEIYTPHPNCTSYVTAVLDARYL